MRHLGHRERECIDWPWGGAREGERGERREGRGEGRRERARGGGGGERGFAGRGSKSSERR